MRCFLLNNLLIIKTINNFLFKLHLPIGSMKHLFLLFPTLLLMVNCNDTAKKNSKVEIINSTIDTVKTVKIPELNITKNFVLGKFNYKTDATFVKVNAKHSAKQLYLKKEAYTAFVELYNAAKTDGIDLKIISGTRNFNEQKAIWERKWERYKTLKPIERAKKILEYSSMPSSSRHHWGTDLDLNNLNNSYFKSGKGEKEYNWLVTNANAFGFYQVYTTKGVNRTGYNLEKWHWSYLPLASQYLAFYNSKISTDAITDFKGSELAKELKIITNYVNGIAKNAKDFN